MSRKKKDGDEGECQKLAAATSSVKSVAMEKKYWYPPISNRGSASILHQKGAGHRFI